jgi:acetoin utilization deacetylase AcuC-like enzyme
MTTVYYNENYGASTYAFETTRKAGRIAATLTDHPKVTVADPIAHVPHTEQHIATVHDPRYVTALKTGTPRVLAEQQGFEWDAGIYPMAVAHSAGLVAATHDVLTTNANLAGSLSSGLHHARYDGGAGFCTINGLVVAAHEAFRLGAERVLVIDFDAHGGGGTRSLTDPNTVVQVDVTVSPYDVWNERSPWDRLDVVLTGNYLNAIRKMLDYASTIPAVDFVLYNAGMDPANAGITAAELAVREELVADWLAARQVPAVYALAGGYLGRDIGFDELVALHRLTIDTFVE